MDEYIVAVDSGGTFSDCVIIDGRGNLLTGKAPSTPPNFATGILDSVRITAEGMRTSAEHVLSRARHFFCHGTTVATNALISRSGVRTALLTTKGHEDSLIIGRVEQKVAGLTEAERIRVYNLDKADPIVPRHLIRGITERNDCLGNTIVRMNEGELLAEVRDLVEGEHVEAIAICFLWSFLNPAHEQRAATLIRARYPELTLCLSSELVPVIKEYERAATTVINAYLTPVVRSYLQSFRKELSKVDFKRSLMIMQDSGGVAEASEVAERPVQLLNSGPVGGLMAARLLASRLGHRNVVTADMGGTSFDVGLIVDGEPLYARAPTYGKYRVLTPTIDVQSIGAGGGSIAWIDEATGLLKVGPRSAGADPGPVCYDHGGTEPTVTDANLALNRINPEYFWGGRFVLKREKSLEAIEQRIAKPLGMDVYEAAAGIIRIVDAHMADLIRRITISRGYDPRDMILYAFGGAGPLHSSAFARQIGGLPMVLIPALSSVFSAYGMAGSDVGVIQNASVPMVAPLDPAKVNEAFARLEVKVREALRRNAVEDSQMRLSRVIEFRYRGQVHEVPVAVPSGTLTQGDTDALVREFEAEYERHYGKGTGYREAGIEARNFRVRGLGLIAQPEPATSDDGGRRAAVAAPEGERNVYFEEAHDFLPTRIYRREKLRPQSHVDGPAVIEAEDTTILVRPGERATADAWGNLLIPVSAAKA